MVDWSSCGPLCQHPSCWESQRRRPRGTQSGSSRTSSIEDTDDIDGLPTQTIINLLDIYDGEPVDRHTSPVSSSRPRSDQLHSCPFHSRPVSEESLLKVRAPNATPATARHSFAEHQSRTSEKPTPHMGKVEVQEVFEANDLRSQWQETFLPKQYYVWVSKPDKPGQPSEKVADAADCASHVAPTDITERLMPREVETHRIAATQSKKPIRSRSPDEMKTSRRHKRKKAYCGIYELLDLPKEVLAHLLEHISERDMLDKKKFADALLKALPDLMRESVSLSLAGSDVLQQKKIDILDGQRKGHRNTEPLETKQVFQLDTEDTEVLHQMNDANAPEEPPGDRVQTDSHTLTRKKTLPLISERKGSAGSVCRKGKLPAISLTLPDIPATGRYTRPFTYKHNDFSFTLGRVPTPPSPEPRCSTGSVSPLSSVRHPIIPATVPAVRVHQMEYTPRMKTGFLSRETTVTTDVDPGLFIAGCYPPVNTPASKSSRRQEWSHIKQGPVMGEVSPAVVSRPPVNIPKVPFDSQPSLDIAGLGTIQEHDLDARRLKSGSAEHRRLRPGDQYVSSTHSPNESPRARSPPQFATATLGSLSARSEVSSVVHQTNQRESATPGGEEAYAESAGAEPWPAVTEEAYERPPSTADRNSGATHSAEFGLYSVLPRSPQISRDSSSVHSGQIKKMLRDKVMAESPGPPPPSPEPKRLSSRERDPVVIIRSREPTSASILDDIAETDSEMTISAKPPSCLDDESRICTPASAPAGGRSGYKHYTWLGPEAAKEPGKTIVKSDSSEKYKLGTNASRESNSSVDPLADSESVENYKLGTHASRESNSSVDPLADSQVSTSGQQHQDGSLQEKKSDVDLQIVKSGVEDGDIGNLQEAKNCSKDSLSESQVHNHDNKQEEVSEFDLVEENPSVKCRSEPAMVEANPSDEYRSESAMVEESPSAKCRSEPAMVEENPSAENPSTEDIEMKDNDLEATIAQLDHFDANEDSFIEELKKEYDKLSE